MMRAQILVPFEPYRTITVFASPKDSFSANACHAFKPSEGTLVGKSNGAAPKQRTYFLQKISFT